MKIFSGVLILISAYLGFSHGWAGIIMKPEVAAMSEGLGISKSFLLAFSVLSIIMACMILIPQTFFAGNLINAFMILLIMALSLRVGNTKMALIEVPFLFLPLLMIYLGHPLKR